MLVYKHLTQNQGSFLVFIGLNSDILFRVPGYSEADNGVIHLNTGVKLVNTELLAMTPNGNLMVQSTLSINV